MKISTKDIFKILAAATIFILFLVFLYKIRATLGMLGAALLLTLLLDPLVDAIQKFMPRKKRWLAITTTFLLFLVGLGAATLLILNPVVNELPNLVDDLKTLTEDISNSGTKDQAISYLEPYIGSEPQSEISNFTKDTVAKIGSTLMGLLSGVSTFVYYFITVITLMFFMLLDTKKALSSGAKIISEKYHKVYNKLTVDLYGIVTKYFAGALMVAGIAGISSYIMLKLLNVPYAASLSLLVALFDLIPMIGATIGATIVIVIALLTGNTSAAVILTGFYVIYQQIENNAIIPLVQRNTVKMSPLAVLVALLIGGAVAGIVGALLAIPAAAFLKVTYSTLKEEGLIGRD